MPNSSYLLLHYTVTVCFSFKTLMIQQKLGEINLLSKQFCDNDDIFNPIFPAL